MSRIHPTALIDPSAELASSVEVGAYCVVGSRVTIGEDCVLRAHSQVASMTRMGRGNVIHSYAMVGGDPQDLKYHGEPTWLEMGDYNQVREYCSIHRGTGNGGGLTKIGSHNLCMACSHVAHDCIVGDHVILANNVMLAGHVQVEDYVNLGGAVGVHHFVRIGYCSFVGGMSRCAKDIPPYMISEGNPASIRGYNHVGMSRLGYSETDIDAMKDAYKMLFRALGGSAVDKVGRLRTQFPDSKAISRLCHALEDEGGGMNGRVLELRRGDDKRAVRAPSAG
ncbi:MAG: acyl-ACP--UDP-N-acetylglucosamine O-acyltransferase [Planctomycetota bacterium]|nr:acyl-ACP--UDP-N-acetylglucosamine O-acyltransferase [Planctomycetota bacterium]MDA1106390.1 acyl-ACP--UDP-N-acetylglucosamine O-acyltransferase [Planctomycetota bacterium]